jgi:hypothetical protein
MPIEKAGAVGQAFDATITAVNGTGAAARRAADRAALLASAEAKVAKLRVHLAGAEAELARLRAEGND